MVYNVVDVGVLLCVGDLLVLRGQNVRWSVQERDVATLHDGPLRRVANTIDYTVETKPAKPAFSCSVCQLGRMHLDVHARVGCNGTKHGHVRFLIVHLKRCLIALPVCKVMSCC